MAGRFFRKLGSGAQRFFNKVSSDAPRILGKISNTLSDGGTILRKLRTQVRTYLGNPLIEAGAGAWCLVQKQPASNGWSKCIAK